MIIINNNVTENNMIINFTLKYMKRPYINKSNFYIGILSIIVTLRKKYS